MLYSDVFFYTRKNIFKNVEVNTNVDKAVERRH
jgi:hypothetical protein